jgi:hypothetical protein
MMFLGLGLMGKAGPAVVGLLRVKVRVGLMGTIPDFPELAG